jgi:hypothetical protein
MRLHTCYGAVPKALSLPLLCPRVGHKAVGYKAKRRVRVWCSLPMPGPRIGICRYVSVYSVAALRDTRVVPACCAYRPTFIRRLSISTPPAFSPLNAVPGIHLARTQGLPKRQIRPALSSRSHVLSNFNMENTVTLLLSVSSSLTHLIPPPPPRLPTTTPFHLDLLARVHHPGGQCLGTVAYSNSQKSLPYRPSVTC